MTGEGIRAGYRNNGRGLPAKMINDASTTVILCQKKICEFQGTVSTPQITSSYQESTELETWQLCRAGENMS
jgi:hypothetical protein